MKKILLVGLLALAGCGPTPNPPWTPPTSVPVPPKPDPLPTPSPVPAVITEADGGKYFLVAKGAKLTFAFAVQLNDSNFFWSVVADDGDMEVLSTARQGGGVTMVVQFDSRTVIKFVYTQFTDTGAKFLKEVVYTVGIK